MAMAANNGVQLNVLAMTNEQILTLIYATHVHADEEFDANSLFIVAKNILKRATHTADNVVGAQSHEDLEEKTPNPSFTPPLCLLKQLSCEMACKDPGEDIPHKTTMAILNKLSTYSWDAKAVLTLSAFASEYGDFWLLAKLNSSDELAKSVGILKRVPVILKRPDLKKHGNSIDELNTLVKATLKVIESIFELENLFVNYIKDIPALSTAMEYIPVVVYWAIMSVVVCTTKMCCLTSDENKTLDLSPFAQKINSTLFSLNSQIGVFKKQKEFIEDYKQLKKLLGTRTEIMEIFKALIFPKDNVQLLIDGSTRKKVSIEELRKKNVLLFFSGLDSSIDDEISILNQIIDEIWKKDQYKIVWIPIVEKWTDDLKKKFDLLLQSKRSWYIVQHFSSVVGIKFIKDEWKFDNKPIVVVMNPQGKVEHQNALHMIRVWGFNAYPFTKEVEQHLLKESNWIDYIMGGIHPSLQKWIREEKHIFFCGGKDNVWIQQFAKKATTIANAIANDSTMKEKRISIETFCLGKGSKGEDDLKILGHFWNKIESLFLCAKANKETEENTVMQEIQKLLSFKNEDGWAILIKGSKVVVSGHGTIIQKVLDDFDKWKVSVSEIGFEACFQEHHDKLIEGDRPCCRVDIPFTAGMVTEPMKCHHCPRVMQTYVSFKCCHVDCAMKGLH